MTRSLYIHDIGKPAALITVTEQGVLLTPVTITGQRTTRRTPKYDGLDETVFLFACDGGTERAVDGEVIIMGDELPGEVVAALWPVAVLLPLVAPVALSEAVS